jgi:hypothetical protein
MARPTSDESVDDAVLKNFVFQRGVSFAGTMLLSSWTSVIGYPATRMYEKAPRHLMEKRRSQHRLPKQNADLEGELLLACLGRIGLRRW